MNRDSSDGVATDYELDGRGSFPSRGKSFFFHVGQASSGAHPPSYPIRTVGFFPGRKAAGAWSWSPPSGTEVENGEAVPPLPYMSSWRRV
jgi:hypothetical protein